MSGLKTTAGAAAQRSGPPPGTIANPDPRGLLAFVADPALHKPRPADTIAAPHLVRNPTPPASPRQPTLSEPEPVPLLRRQKLGK